MLPTLLLLVAAASWGGNWVAARWVTLDVPPFALSFWRWALASALLLPVAAAQLRADAPLIRRHLPALAAFGLIGGAGFTLLGYWGVRYTTAVNATLLNSSLPFFLLEIHAGGTMTVSPGTVAAIAYLAIFPSIVAYICWNHAVMALGPNVAGFFNPVIPVFGTLFAVTFLGEPLRLYHLAGFA